MTKESLSQPENNQLPNSNLSLSVLERIEREHVVQVPRWQFLLSEYGIWILWALSVLIGALSFAMMIFFMLHAGFAVYEATHETPLDFFVDVLPAMWIIVFIVMALVAHVNLRHTKRGYKYHVWQILLSSIIFSLFGGILFHSLGMAFFLDNFMSKRIPLFPGLQVVETRIWQAPLQGRVVGMYSGNGSTTSLVKFTDSRGMVWDLDISEFSPLDLENLYSKDVVHVLGVQATSTEAYFFGCNVFQSSIRRSITFSDITLERQRFIERMEAHQEKLFDELFATGTLPAFIKKPVCAGHSAVLRIHKKMSR